MYIYLTDAPEHWTLPSDNSLIGPILCAEKDHVSRPSHAGEWPNKVLVAEF
jgi:hypothetical protein